MKKRMVFISLVCSIFLVGCSSGSKDVSKQTDSKKVEQKLTISSESAISTMVPSLAMDTTSTLVMNQVYEGLYTLGKNDKFELGVAAEEPDISKDQTVYTFKLRKDAKWSNGTPVTADDFVFAWQKLVDPQNVSPNADILFNVVKNAKEVAEGKRALDELGIRAIDDNTLEITLEKPTPYLVSLLSFPVLYPQNRAYVQSQGEKYASDAEHLIYNGPFKLSKWSAVGDNWSYVKNETYWDEKTVKLKTADVTVVKSPSTAINLFKTGELDVVNKLSGDFVANYRNDPAFVAVPQFVTFFIKMNGQRNGKTSILNNINARKAIAQAFDKKGFVKSVLADKSTPTDQLIPPGQTIMPDGKTDFVKSAEKANDYLTYNPKKALALWKKAKDELKIENVTLQFLTDDTDSAKRSAEYFQNQLETHLPGLKIEVTQVPFTIRVQRDQSKDYDLELSGWGTDYRDPLTVLRIFTSDSTQGGVTFSDPTYDQLINQTRNEYAGNQEQRMKNFMQAQNILINKVAVLAPIYNRSLSVLENTKIKNLYWHSFGPTYSLKWAEKQ
ncbi:peptide ABC transporter substrate-binding protein [Enterococcus columbae]|uniref:Pheromone-binding protein n=1 Tax=Enterococcus columbae DSM 7374 = ATCC 51263 TaxID=1121865 RepID=S1P452_9ENTE|nr:peptide ABC transporter substrate-binding protein [Enterococcus columbae]EOT38500.1 pheromone-binding protein [Enterococcus columbae DSM 7374 = ATCC 51263]EOW87849.1 pheromone-binding protein [Enterococcus columbae DSM 7374 = ATCC 51263]OJG22957.1 pheromone-binding protein [Enterococcus columbae DSM 7374 = ATCC 51263]